MTEQSDDFVQLIRRRVEVKKVPRGEEPIVQLRLSADQRVVQVKQTYSSDLYSVDRKTVDYVFEVWTEWRG